MSRAPVGGADFLIVQAIQAGNAQLPGIATWAQVEQVAARDALNRLRKEGRVRRYGTTRHARYVVIERRRKGAKAA